jgi:hypothetical protein
MGKLRLEPKVKPLLNEEEYRYYKKALLEARTAAVKNNVFWDLEPDESIDRTRRYFRHVAEREGIALNLRGKRKEHCIVLSFPQKAPRKSAEESRKRIVERLKRSGKPLKKSEILQDTDISTSAWNLRIKELIEAGQVKKEGSRRQTRYSLA